MADMKLGYSFNASDEVNMSSVVAMFLVLKVEYTTFKINYDMNAEVVNNLSLDTLAVIY